MKRLFLFALLGLYVFAAVLLAGWIGIRYGALSAWCFLGFALGLLNVFQPGNAETDERQ